MPKQTSTLIGLIGATAALMLSKAGAQSPSTQNYFPAKVGDSWTMRVHVPNQGDIDGVIVVAKSEPEKTGAAVTRETHLGKQVVAVDIFHVTPQGVLQFGGKDRTHFDPPLPILKFPIKSGSKWTYTGTMFTPKAGIPITATMELTGPAPLKTPTGTLQAVKVQGSIIGTIKEGQKMGLTLTYWFAPGVGIVQTQMDAPSTGAGGLTHVITTVQRYKVL